MFSIEKRTRLAETRGEGPVEAAADLTLAEAVEMVDDLAGVSDEDGIAQLEPGKSHTYSLEDGSEVEITREPGE